MFQELHILSSMHLSLKILKDRIYGGFGLRLYTRLEVPIINDVVGLFILKQLLYIKYDQTND